MGDVLTMPGVRRSARGKHGHHCCPNATHHLVGWGTDHDHVNWRLGMEGTTVSVIYCPWCGVNLNAG
jgi:hypothetical protein